MKAVILAAGRGRRLGALTESIPKPMLDVGGMPIIVRILKGLASAGVGEAVVVTGHAYMALESAIGDGSHSGIRVLYVRQQQPRGTAHAVSLAQPLVGDNPFFFGWGDILVRTSNYGAVLAAATAGDGALAVNEVDDPWAGAAVYVSPDGFVKRIVEKPPKGTAGTRWNNAGFGVLPAEVWGVIEKLSPSPRGELELPDAITVLLAHGARFKAVPVVGPWADVGTPEQLEHARRLCDNGQL